MNYIHTQTQQKATLDDIKNENPNTSFPATLTDEDLSSFGYAILHNTQPPTYDDLFKTLQEGPIQFIDDKWQTTWIIEDLPEEESNKRLLQRYDSILTSHLDSVAQQKNYDNRITCALRAGYAGPFQEEGIAFASWMDNCNHIAHKYLEDIQNGTRSKPESPSELLSLLPEMVWP